MVPSKLAVGLGHKAFVAAEGGAGWISACQHHSTKVLTLGTNSSTPAAAVGKDKRNGIWSVAWDREGVRVRADEGDGEVEDGLRTNLR